ncbi:glycosyltransferase family 4 protein [Ruminococcus sp.]|uniref:glycosyltransferase family 4 protein n=1 Tax=Ruminococcus sp. TaxID=41978 RepID=UPI0025FDF8AC|nr:glycosyltransferase family 4 protein [Ruminococcus sp.]
MKKIKLLYITRKYPPAVGGMENFSYNLYNNFDPSKVDADIISLGKSQKHLAWFLPYALLKTVFKAGKYDVVFVGDALLSSVGFFTKLFHPRKKVVVNVFGLDITFKNKLYQLYLKLFYNKFDRYISISRETDETFRKRGGKRSCVINCGVDTEQFSGECADYAEICRKNGISEDDTVIITVGRLVKRKGVDWFVRNVMPELKDEKVKYLIVGDGEDRETIAEGIEKYGLGDKVKMLGRVETAELNSVYTHADAFIMPNIHVDGDMEGFGLVAVEASLAGLAVFASGIEGIRDAVIDGKNGWIMESGNAKQYAERVKDLCAHRDEYRKKAAEYSRYTRDTYSWKSICAKYVELFEKMLGKGKK